MGEVAIECLVARVASYSPFVRYVKDYYETVLNKLKGITPVFLQDWSEPWN